VVAFENHSAGRGVPGDNLDDSTRVSAIANQIAEEAKAFRAALPSMAQARVQGFQIAVDIRQQGGQQWRNPIRCYGVPSILAGDQGTGGGFLRRVDVKQISQTRRLLDKLGDCDIKPDFDV
jgi:hypothetical protein